MEVVHGKTDEWENEWDHKISAGVKEGPADCIRIAEVYSSTEEDEKA